MASGWAWRAYVHDYDHGSPLGDTIMFIYFVSLFLYRFFKNESIDIFDISIIDRPALSPDGYHKHYHRYGSGVGLNTGAVAYSSILQMAQWDTSLESYWNDRYVQPNAPIRIAD